MAMERQTFTRSGNPPDLPTLATAIRPTIGDPFYLRHQLDDGVLTVIVEKPTAWIAGDVTTVQTAVNAAADATLRSEAQAWVDEMPLGDKAFILTLLDQINTLRAFHSLAAVTPAQALAAVKTKAGQL